VIKTMETNEEYERTIDKLVIPHDVNMHNFLILSWSKRRY
jgi:hypothetical protein